MKTDTESLKARAADAARHIVAMLTDPELAYAIQQDATGTLLFNDMRITLRIELGDFSAENILPSEEEN